MILSCPGCSRRRLTTGPTLLSALPAPLIGFGQCTTLFPDIVAIRDPLRFVITTWWSQDGKVREREGKTKGVLQQGVHVHTASLTQYREQFQHAASERDEMGPIQTTNLDEFSAHPCACTHIPIVHDLKMSTIGIHSRIRHRCNATHRITLTACIH